MTLLARPSAVLFDLDGTLADTAPDLLAALARLRAHIGLDPIDVEHLRNVASRGAVAILDQGLPELDDQQRAALRPRYLDDYRNRCWEASRPFAGMPELLAGLESAGIAWGVVTNKLEGLARPLIEQAGWAERIGCLIGGDTAANPKPAPDPVVAACAVLGVEPGRTVFVGDDERDVIAGNAAGSFTVAARWGYIADPGIVDGWGAGATAESPGSLATLLALESTRAAV